MKSLTRNLGALMVVAALALGLAALMPAHVEAVSCFCPPGNHQTTTGWTMGFSTCAAAKAACQTQARSKAYNFCSSTFGTSVCSWGSLTFTQPNCSTDEHGDFFVDCQQKFACERCIDTPPM